MSQKESKEASARYPTVHRTFTIIFGHKTRLFKHWFHSNHTIATFERTLHQNDVPLLPVFDEKLENMTVLVLFHLNGHG